MELRRIKIGYGKGKKHKKASHFCEAFTSVGPEGFEPPTLWV